MFLSDNSGRRRPDMRPHLRSAPNEPERTSDLGDRCLGRAEARRPMLAALHRCSRTLTGSSLSVCTIHLLFTSPELSVQGHTTGKRPMALVFEGFPVLSDFQAVRPPRRAF